MTQEEFKKILNEEKIQFIQEGETIVINGSNYGDDVFLGHVSNLTIPSNLRFENKGMVGLTNLKTLPSNVTFANKSSVVLHPIALSNIKNTKFKNKNSVFFYMFKKYSSDSCKIHGTELEFKF